MVIMPALQSVLVPQGHAGLSSLAAVCFGACWRHWSRASEGLLCKLQQMTGPTEYAAAAIPSTRRQEMCRHHLLKRLRDGSRDSLIQ